MKREKLFYFHQSKDGSDDENEGLFNHMHPRLLTAPCPTNIKRNVRATDEGTSDECSNEKMYYQSQL